MPQARPEIRAAKEALTTDEFKRALEQGLGRAILCLKKHDPTLYKQTILETCLKDTRYDQQSEGSRVPYLMEAIDLCHDEDFFRDLILDAYPTTPSKAPDYIDDNWIEQQFTDFALAFAKRGHEKARKLLYESFAINPEYSEKFALGRARSITELDGLEGLTFVLEQYTKVAREILDYYPSSWFKKLLAKRHSEEVVERHLEELCGANPDIQSFIEHFEGQLETRKPNANKKPTATYAQFQSMLQQRSDYPGGIRFWGKRATKTMFKQVAREFLQQTDPELIRGYLYAFCYREFPFSLKHLLRLVVHEHQDVRLHSVIALHNVQHPRVRELGLELIEDTHLRSVVVGLFERNYLLGDAEKIVRVLQNINDPDEIHSVGYCVRDVYEENRVSEALEPLTLQYELNLCSQCREFTIQLLHDLEILPDWILEEAQFDANSDTRETVQAWLKPRTP
jgi:hypothetical protein